MTVGYGGSVPPPSPTTRGVCQNALAFHTFRLGYEVAPVCSPPYRSSQHREPHTVANHTLKPKCGTCAHLAGICPHPHPALGKC